MPLIRIPLSRSRLPARFRRLAHGALCASLLLAGSACHKEEEPEPPPTPRPSPTPIPTPHPALGAQEAAKKLYPELAKKDSLFHRTFIEVFDDQRIKHPVALTTVDWPLDVARRTAEILGVSQYDPTTPFPVATPRGTPRTLDRRPYEQRRTMSYPRVYPYATPYP